MEKDKKTEEKEEEEVEAIELVLFQVSECYVYMVNFIIQRHFFVLIFALHIYLYVA